MVCPDCKKEYENDRAVCPGCGEQNEAMQTEAIKKPVSAPKPHVGRWPK